MKDIISKLLSDFRLAKVKLLLMIMAAALSSWGISSVMYGYMMAERDFEVNFGRTFPADIEIVVENYRPGLKDILLADENVIDIERREVLGGRVKNRDDEWMPFTLYGVKDIENMRLNVFQILKENGNSKNKILIETNALFFLDPKQDSIKVDLADRGKIAWKIGGISHDPRLPPARMEGTVFAHATSFEVL